MVAVANERRSLTRGLDSSDLTGRNLVLWKRGHLKETVANEIDFFTRSTAVSPTDSFTVIDLIHNEGRFIILL